MSSNGTSDAVSDGPFHPQRQSRGADGGCPGQPDGYAAQRLPHDLSQEGLRGGGVRCLHRHHRRGGLQLLHLPGGMGRGQAHHHPGGAPGSQRRAFRHPAGLYGGGGHSVRLLHPGLHSHRLGDPGERKGILRRGIEKTPLRPSVPLHRV